MADNALVVGGVCAAVVGACGGCLAPQGRKMKKKKEKSKGVGFQGLRVRTRLPLATAFCPFHGPGLAEAGWLRCVGARMLDVDAV